MKSERLGHLLRGIETALNGVANVTQHLVACAALSENIVARCASGQTAGEIVFDQVYHFAHVPILRRTGKAANCGRIVAHSHHY